MQGLIKVTLSAFIENAQRRLAPKHNEGMQRLPFRVLDGLVYTPNMFRTSHPGVAAQVVCASGMQAPAWTTHAHSSSLGNSSSVGCLLQLRSYTDRLDTNLTINCVLAGSVYLLVRSNADRRGNEPLAAGLRSDVGPRRLDVHMVTILRQGCYLHPRSV